MQSALLAINMRSDSEGSNGPDPPAGVLRSRGGWQDADNLEIEHAREKLRLAEEQDPSERKASTHAAVDLSQFRNEEVGKGYKAKHVVRQREAAPAVAGVMDMSGGQFSKKERGAKKKRSRDDGGKKDTNDERDRLQTYLKCKGMRDFVKEIDGILKQR